MLDQLAALFARSASSPPPAGDVLLTDVWCCVSDGDSQSEPLCSVVGRSPDATERFLDVVEAQDSRLAADGRGWRAREHTLVALPDQLDSPLATLAPALAQAEARVAAMPRHASAVALDDYRLHNALVHVEMQRQRPTVDSLLTEDSPVRRCLAFAFGARVNDGSGVPVPPLPATRPAPGALHAALARLTAEPWRYRPLITHTLLPHELDDTGAVERPDAIAVVLRVAAHPGAPVNHG